MDLDFAASAKPFASVVLCCTGIELEDRSVLVDHAQKMGASFSANLQSSVTHMIVGNVDTPKYQFAAQNRFDLKIMDLNWVKEAYDKWIQGEDVNFDETVAAHILPPLFDLHICLTNISSPEDRKQIEIQIKLNGGDYHPHLSRQCTHLLCASPTGKKYEAALKWGIHCVGVEWLFQSIERGMALDPKYFGVDIEPAKRGEGAWDRNAAIPLSGQSSLLTLFDQKIPVEFENGGRKRRLRRTGSQMAQEGIWEGILGGVVEPQDVNYQLQTDNQMIVDDQSFVQQIPIGEESGANETPMNVDEPPNGLFDGLIFYTWGFTEKKREVLTDVITKNSGLLFTKPLPGVVNDPSTSFTVIPFKCPVEDAPLGYGGSQLVTEMWVERCIVANATFDPNELVMCKPMPGPFPRPYLRNIAISITGFCGPDLLHVEQLIVLLGADFYNTLTRKRSLLLTPGDQKKGPKQLKAEEWDVPIVNVEWLWETIRRGDDEVDIGPWCDRPAALVRYTPDEASSGVKPAVGNSSTCPPAIGAGRNSVPPDQRREKRVRQHENIPPHSNEFPVEDVKMEQLTKLLETVSSPQKKTRRRLAGRARNEPVSTTQSPEDQYRQTDEEDVPKSTQEKVEYKDPIAEREMAKIIANLQGTSEEDKAIQIQNTEMTPAEDIGRRGGRRKSGRK